MTDIVMVTWGRQELTEMSIRAIRKNTKQDNFRLIVIDNYSPQPMMHMLLKMYEAGMIDELVLNDSNKGLEPARNQGLGLVKSDLFICADNDLLPPKIEDGKDWIERLAELMDKYPAYGAISARTQVMIGTGNIFDRHEDEDIVEFSHPGGSFRIMRTDAVREVGGWRDDSKGRGSEERYICRQLRDKNWKTGFAVQVKCLHLFGDKETDRWGYPKDWKPEDTGHNDIWHPVLESGDDPEEIKEYYDA